MANPMEYQYEHGSMQQRAITYTLLLDRQSPITTPYDMMINRAAETRHRHGSCGLGIWETLVRQQVR